MAIPQLYSTTKTMVLHMMFCLFLPGESGIVATTTINPYIVRQQPWLCGIIVAVLPVRRRP